MRLLCHVQCVTSVLQHTQYVTTTHIDAVYMIVYVYVSVMLLSRQYCKSRIHIIGKLSLSICVLDIHQCRSFFLLLLSRGYRVHIQKSSMWYQWACAFVHAHCRIRFPFRLPGSISRVCLLSIQYLTVFDYKLAWAWNWLRRLDFRIWKWRFGRRRRRHFFFFRSFLFMHYNTYNVYCVSQRE